MSLPGHVRNEHVPVQLVCKAQFLSLNSNKNKTGTAPILSQYCQLDIQAMNGASPLSHHNDTKADKQKSVTPWRRNF